MQTKYLTTCAACGFVEGEDADLTSYWRENRFKTLGAGGLRFESPDDAGGGPYAPSVHVVFCPRCGTVRVKC